MTLPPAAAAVLDDYTAAVDEVLPGWLTGLYVLGSVALGDFRADRSDVDVVAVGAGEAGPAELGALAEVHRRVRAAHPRPHLDGVYLTADELARGPRPGDRAPYSHEGRFVAAGTFGLDPITWHTLADRGVTVRGRRPDELDVWTDRAVLDRWLRDNLAGYWTSWQHRAARLTSPPGLAALSGWAAEWGVLGVARIQCTLATGTIVSKEDGGRYALGTVPPRWHRVLAEAVRLRRGEAGPRYRTPFGRRRDVLGFVRAAVEAGRPTG